jgi:hypothetical protein
MLAEDTLNKYKENSIQALKSPKGSTPQVQALDQKPFKAMKTSLRNMVSDKCKDPIIEKRIRDVMERRDKSGLGNARVENVAKGVEMIVYALHAVINAKLVKSGFSVCGFNYATGESEFRTLANRCGKINDITVEQFQKIEDAIPELIDIFTEHGDILEEENDGLGIPKE